MGTEEQREAVEHYPLRQIYFYLTKGCNLRCRHCWIAPEHQTPDRPLPSLDPGLFRSVVEQGRLLGLRGVKLTGGEPLLHPNLGEMLSIVRSRQLDLVMETNGTLCTPEMARRVRDSSRRPFVSVSIDGADPETHDWVRGVDGAFEAAVSGAGCLAEAGIRTQLIMSVMRRNAQQMEAVVRLAEKLGLESVKFNPVQPTARGDRMHRAMETLPIRELVRLGRWVHDELSGKTALRLVFCQPMAFRPLGRMFGRGGDGCAVCNVLGILGVLADGSYSLCGIGETVPDLVFGHAGRDRLEDVWRGSPVLNELRGGLPGMLEGVCGDCLMKALCMGSCVAQNYYASGRLTAPFWYCEQAMEGGLFPESRLRPALGVPG
ncbi:SynChlorMet cassette radical SAM/SPASM protein ScmF [Candidatus Fermentibacterales bacterium]|nr:SynChlorMet cassette radical SAM/SPASM protein ScmF [Candidatus Fermentibacterales bacterium]